MPLGCGRAIERERNPLLGFLSHYPPYSRQALLFLCGRRDGGAFWLNSNIQGNAECYGMGRGGQCPPLPIYPHPCKMRTEYSRFARHKGESPHSKNSNPPPKAAPQLLISTAHRLRRRLSGGGVGAAAGGAEEVYPLAAEAQAHRGACHHLAV